MKPQTIQLTTHRLDPAEAEIRIEGAADVTGRLMGPRCHYASTVEVAYYVKPMPGGGARAIVPEPSFWDPQTPFLYEAVLRTESGATLACRHGLRTLQLSPAGWRLNRKPFRVAGVCRSDLSEAEELRAAGVNTILCPVGRASADVWERGDALGFFVLGILSGNSDAIAVAQELTGHASCLGWIFDEADMIDPTMLQTRSEREPFIGLRIASPTATPPPWVRFLAGPASLEGSRLPWLLLNDGDDNSTEAPLGMIRL